MAPIRGRPFLEYQLDYWIAQGVRRFVLSVGYKFETIVDHFEKGYRGAKVEFVVEEMPLGTGGAFLLAIQKVTRNAPLLLLNGDTYFAVDLEDLTTFAKQSNADWCLALFRASEPSRYMSLSMSAQGQITSLNSAPTESLVNGGVYWIHPRALERGPLPHGQKLSLENDILPAELASGRRMFGREFRGVFVDIGVPHDYDRAQALLTMRVHPKGGIQRS
jgi:D-glycero-alpha-D-manno-heptose 1-phosphate guanylyltransferase